MTRLRVRSGLAAAVAAAVACCAAAAWAQKSDEPISVGYREQVFVVKSEGGARRLTRGPDEHSEAAWARGRRIAVVAGDDRIEVRDLAGRVLDEIRGGVQATGQASWSPDGRRIAFVAYHRCANGALEGNLVVTSADGSDRRVLATHVTGRPAWSADGRTLFYLRGTRESYRTTTADSLWSVPSDSGAARRLEGDLAPTSQALVSPDGRWVLFGRLNGLWITRARHGGGGERRVTKDGRVHSYGWAPGGGAVYAGKHKNRPIVTSLDGRRRVLGVRMGGSYQYQWSPDGKRLAWVDRGLSGSGMRVLSARPDGTGRKVVARFTSQTRLVEVDTLEWSPRGGRFAIVPFRHIGD